MASIDVKPFPANSGYSCLVPMYSRPTCFDANVQKWANCTCKSKFKPWLFRVDVFGMFRPTILANCNSRIAFLARIGGQSIFQQWEGWHPIYIYINIYIIENNPNVPNHHFVHFDLRTALVSKAVLWLWLIRDNVTPEQAGDPKP